MFQNYHTATERLILTLNTGLTKTQPMRNMKAAFPHHNKY